MDKKRAKEILLAHACCSFSNKGNDLCEICPWSDTSDCVDTAFEEDLMIEVIKILKGELEDENN